MDRPLGGKPLCGSSPQLLVGEVSASHVVGVMNPRAVVFLVFWTGAAAFSSRWLLSCARGAGWAPIWTRYFWEGVVVPGVEPRPLDLLNYTHNT
jgi:hypothetical protein